MDPDQEEAEVFITEDSTGLRLVEEEDNEEEDARSFNTWMQQYRGGKEEEEEEAGGQRPESRSSLGTPVQMRANRRASLPCQTTLSAMQLSRLNLSSRAPLTARLLLRRSSSRCLLPSPQEAAAPVPTPTAERRPSLIPAIPETTMHERKSQFRRRNVMSLSDADSVCLICHNNLNQGTGGTRELQCTHTFHKECIEDWLWRKQCCPTCHVQVSMPQPIYWSSTRVKVP
ncbi:putative RING-H2 finger protein ATL71 [Echeneis naucrates]|uniref:putative RING-H2 finger protein ATL71 n=1 Tax=Echeneis naucrates TaxID=173247 RepID=UPI00111424D5|nr:putative RING-H2 finger protein ATL71 [Echeneis naucrates]XP_029377000.1 putative RING-H2 finger protein ATL71 [Echeneis naucrates]XP_029377010.1 putative RING-H2 finger protein ATL71 [Echeneis naucrates]